MDDGLTDQDRRDLAELERASRRPRGSGDGGGLDEVLSLDLSAAGAVGVIWPEGKHPFEITGVEKKASQPRFNEKTQTMNEGGVPYAELQLTCIGGDMKDETLSDRLMLAGKGLSRFVIFADAIGMYDKENKSFTGKLADFIGQRVWGAVVTEKSSYQGRARERSIIDFAGYEPITAYAMPDGEVFDEDLETLPIPYQDEQEEMEPVEELPLEAPVGRPAARRAVAAAGAPGNKPPWSTPATRLRHR